MKRLIWALLAVLLLAACAPVPDGITEANLDRYVEMCKLNEGLSKFYPESWANNAMVYCRNGAIFYFNGGETVFSWGANKQ